MYFELLRSIYFEVPISISFVINYDALLWIHELHDKIKNVSTYVPGAAAAAIVAAAQTAHRTQRIEHSAKTGMNE